jgi:hypothetical protein
MRAAVILNGIVSNIIVLNSLSEMPGAVEAETANLGDVYDADAHTFTPPPLTAEQIIATLTASVQTHLDSAARAKGYDGILSAASYAGDANFGAEGTIFRDWRGAVWATCYAIMADVEAGNRPTPDATTLISELPILNLV